MQVHPDSGESRAGKDSDLQCSFFGETHFLNKFIHVIKFCQFLKCSTFQSDSVFQNQCEPESECQPESSTVNQKNPGGQVNNPSNENNPGGQKRISKKNPSSREGISTHFLTFKNLYNWVFIRILQQHILSLKSVQ